MEGLSKMERHNCSGAFLQIIGQEKCVNSLEGLLKIGVPGIRSGTRNYRNYRNNRNYFPELNRRPQLGATVLHAPGARMT